MSLTWSTEACDGTAGHLIEWAWTLPVYLLLSQVFIATDREKKTPLGCVSPQISHEVCPEVYLAGGGFSACQLKPSPADEMLLRHSGTLLLAKSRLRKGLEEQQGSWDGDGK